MTPNEHFILSRARGPTGFRVGCSCPDNQGPVFGTYADAEEWYSANQVPNAETLAGCDYAGQEGYCEVDIPFIKVVRAEEARASTWPMATPSCC